MYVFTIEFNITNTCIMHACMIVGVHRVVRLKTLVGFGLLGKKTRVFASFHVKVWARVCIMKKKIHSLIKRMTIKIVHYVK